MSPFQLHCQCHCLRLVDFVNGVCVCVPICQLHWLRLVDFVNGGVWSHLSVTHFGKAAYPISGISLLVCCCPCGIFSHYIPT